MKEGWEYKKLDDICTIVGRIGFRGYTKADLVDSPNDGAITLSPSNITNGELDFSKCTYISWDKYNESPEIMLTKGDVVLVKTASIGKCAVVKELPHKATLNPQFVVLKGIIGEPNFIGYYLKSPVAQITIKQMAGGVAIPTLSQKKLGTMLIPSPPLSEQQSIVDYLDSAFAKIDAMKANAEKALNEAKALFQASLKEMLEPKEGWEEKKLGDICSDIRYGTSTPSNENGEYKYLRMNNITNDGFLDVSHYKTISLPEKELEKCLVKRGDIIFNRTNSRELVGKSCVFTEDENMVIAGYLIRIRLKEGFEPQFITYSMNLQRSLGLFQHLIVGAVHQANISANNIQKVIINYPPLSEQKSIVATLDSLKSKVDRLQANYDKISQECDALKQSILRQVFE